METSSGPGVGIANTGALISQAINATIPNSMDFIEQQQYTQQHQQSQQQSGYPPSQLLTQQPPLQQQQLASTDVTTSQFYRNNVNTLQPSNSEESKRLKRHHKESELPIYNVHTSNRYELLTPDENTDSVNNQQSASAVTIKIPPIIVHNADNYERLISDIKSVTSGKFLTKTENNNIKILFQEIKDFREFRHFCEQNKVQYHTFRDPTVKKLSVVIKDVPTYFKEEDITNELKAKNFPVLKCTRLFNKNKSPIQVVAVDLIDSDESRLIYNISDLNYCKIRVFNRVNTQGPIQCKKCQRYGHSQANCGLTPRCVRCTGNHHYSQCKLPKNGTMPTCVNCLQHHTANYKGCPVYKDISKSLNKPLTFTRNSNNTPQPKIPGNLHSHSLNADPTQPNSNKHFPPLPNRSSIPNYTPANSTTNQWSNHPNNIPIFLTNIITQVVTQVLNSLMPHIQSYILSTYQNV